MPSTQNDTFKQILRQIDSVDKRLRSLESKSSVGNFPDTAIPFADANGKLNANASLFTFDDTTTTLGMASSGTNGSGIWLQNNSGTTRRSSIRFLNSGVAQMQIGMDISLNNTRNFYVYDEVSTATRFLIDPNGSIGVPSSNSLATFGLDATLFGADITLANNATATPFSNANNYSGLFIINPSTINGAVAAFVTGGGGIATLGASAANVYTNTAGTASRINVYLVANVLTIENKMGASLTFKVLSFRTRTSQ